MNDDIRKLTKNRRKLADMLEFKAYRLAKHMEYLANILLSATDLQGKGI